MVWGCFAEAFGASPELSLPLHHMLCSDNSENYKSDRGQWRHRTEHEAALSALGFSDESGSKSKSAEKSIGYENAVTLGLGASNERFGQSNGKTQPRSVRRVLRGLGPRRQT
jgi:hypothetical protein